MAFIPPDKVGHSFVRQQGQGVIPADFGEYAGAAAEAFLHNNRSISEPVNLANKYRGVMDAYKAATGKDFEYIGRTGRGQRQSVRNAVPVGRQSVGAFWERMQEELEQNPELGGLLGFRSHEELVAAIHQESRQLEAQRDDIAARASGIAAFGGMAGEMAAVVTDPPIAASMVLAAPLASSLLGGVLIEAAIAGGAEALVQPVVQNYRREAGLEAGFQQGVENVLTAAAAGGAFYGTFRVAGMGYSAMVDAVRGKRTASDATEGEVDLSSLTPEQRAALMELEKAALIERTDPIGNGTPEDAALHQRRVEEARMALVQGRAVQVRADQNPLDLGMETISLNVLAKRLRSLESVGLDLDEMLPGLGRILDETNNGLEAVLARDRVDGVVRELRTAVAEERPVLEAVKAAEERYEAVLARQADNTNRQLREALQEQQVPREGLIGQDEALGALEAADRAEVANLTRRMQDASDEALARSFRTQRARLLDKGRKRVSRERDRMRADIETRAARMQELEAEAKAIEAERVIAEAERKQAGEALLAARRRREEAAGNFNARIGTALSNDALKRMHRDYVEAETVSGSLPPGKQQRIAEAREHNARLEDETTGAGAARIREAQMGELTEEAIANLPDDFVVPTPDGRTVSPREMLDEIEQDRTFLEEFRGCFLNANSA